jgi:cysteine desulfurase/selenocysteine lyase
LHAEDIAHLMDAGGFALRTGHHCAQPLLAALGISSTVRASFWIHNSIEEADSFIAHMTEIIKRFG